MATSGLRSFPSIALRIPTAHNFTRDVISMHTHQKMVAFSIWLDLAIEVNHHYFKNECIDL